MTKRKNFSDWNTWTRRVIPEELRKNNIFFEGINEAWTYRGKRIPWKAKQEIKDDMIEKEKTAIEFIKKDISKMEEDECFMVSIPNKIQLPFGLFMDKRRRC